jgi:hypothetical protein
MWLPNHGFERRRTWNSTKLSPNEELLPKLRAYEVVKGGPSEDGADEILSALFWVCSTQEVRSECDWTPSLLSDRQKRLVGVFEHHWDLTTSGDQAEAVSN